MTETFVRFAPAPGPLDNPLKGWATYVGTPIYQPYSMVFFYVPWSQLEPNEGDYQFADWEAKTWNVPQAMGKHVVFRVYIDYPGRPSGLPGWLRARGVAERSYSAFGGGNSPDYENPQVVAGLQRLIAALGARYDRNPRVAFIEAGLLGHWGEWHTYPDTALFASEATQQRVLDAYHSAFPNTKILSRYPDGVAGRKAWLGFHDDYFPEDTGLDRDSDFCARMKRSGRTENWRTAPICGEMIPESGKNALKWLGSPGDFAFTQRAAETAHFSWIGPYSPALNRPPNSAYYANCQALVRRMGYQFRLNSLRHDAGVRVNQPFSFTLSGANEGIAPFYYPWEVRVALLGPAGNVVAQAALPDIDIRRWQPGPWSFRARATFPPLKPGRYSLALGIVDPYSGRSSIGFANTLPLSHQGWTILSTIAAQEPAVPEQR